MHQTSPVATNDESRIRRCDLVIASANVPGKARAFMPYVNGVKTCNDICGQVPSKGYEGLRRG